MWLKKKLILLAGAYLLPLLASSQQVSISTIDGFYYAMFGKGNPLSCTVKKIPCKSVSLSTDNGNIIKSGCDYIFQPADTGLACITINQKVNGEWRKIGEFSMTVIDLNYPMISTGGFVTGDIPKGALLAQAGLSCNSAHHSYFFNPLCKIESFVTTILRKDSAIFRSVHAGNLFNGETLNAFRQLQNDDIVELSGITYIAPAGHRKQAGKLIYRIIHQ